MSYYCGKCGEVKQGEPPHYIGMEDIRKYKDGEVVPDVLVYACERCFRQIRSEVRDGSPAA